MTLISRAPKTTAGPAAPNRTSGPVFERLLSGDGFAGVHRRGPAGSRGRILIVPPFGVPARALDLVADELDRRGFESFTLDPRHHVGDGSGDIEQYRVSSVVEDCRAALDRYRPTCVVAVSLGARAALRAIAGSPDAPDAVLLIPVVDLRSTLSVVLGHDWAPAPELPPHLTVLGYDIAAEPFRQDCLDHDLLTSSGTELDLARHRGRITLISGDADPWVEAASVARIAERAARRGGHVRVRSVPCDQHELHKHPELALRMIAAGVEEVAARSER